MSKMKKETLTDLLGIQHPIIMAPMFLVSNTKMVIEGMKSGIAGCIPALNYRTLDELRASVKELKANKVDGPVILFFPKGRFVLKDILYIERSNIVLRGSGAEGKNATTIYMPLALNELPTPKIMTELQEYLIENNIVLCKTCPGQFVAKWPRTIFTQKLDRQFF